MHEIDYFSVLNALREERHNETQCAIASYELMKKTINPIKRIKYSLSADRFMEHAFGIDLAIMKIQKEFGP